jgi:branched-chain amino acid transport system substrate-binding protein
VGLARELRPVTQGGQPIGHHRDTLLRSTIVKRISRSIALLAVVSATALTAGACSSGTDTATDVWRIGLEAPLTGSQSVLGQGMLAGAQLAADDINAAGGLMGKQIEIVQIDDAADPATGVAAANKAISEGINGVVGPYNSSVGLQTLPLYEDAGLVPIRLTSDNATEGRGITLQPMTSQIAPVTSKALSKFYGAKKVVILYDPTQEYTTSASAAVKQELEAAGVTITNYTQVQPGQDQATYTSAIKAAEATKPDAIYSAVYYPEGAMIAQAVKDTKSEPGATSCLLDYSAYDNGYVENAGVTVAQACDVVGVPAPSDFPNSAQYVDAYKTKFNTAPGTWSPYTYDSVKVLTDSVAKVGKWDSQEIQSALSSVSGWTGWTGSVTIEPSTGNRVPATVVVTQVADDGSFQVNPRWSGSPASKN